MRLKEDSLLEAVLPILPAEMKEEVKVDGGCLEESESEAVVPVEEPKYKSRIEATIRYHMPQDMEDLDYLAVSGLLLILLYSLRI